MAAMSPEEHLKLMRRLGVPRRLVVPDGAAPSSSPSSVRDGELPGVRQTMAEFRASGEDEATVQRVAREYDRSVRSGAEPFPTRRD